jgi:hypothetical protein
VWSKTNGQLYHKLSPYTNDSGLIAWGNEPYNYVFPDKTNAFLNGKYDSFSLPIGSAASDVMRMGRFITSGKGVLFLAKNLLLQTGNAFNETRLYSPTEVLVSAARPATLGLINRPTRHIDISGGGLMGILGSLVGIGSENSNQPSGTVNGPSDDTVFNKSPLSSNGEYISTETRGLSRAGTANAGLANFNSKWVGKQSGAGFFGSLFANFIPATQDGIIYKSCEGAYGSMISNNLRLKYTDVSGCYMKHYQKWIAGGKIMRPKDEDSNVNVTFFADAYPLGGFHSGDISDGNTRILTMPKVAPKNVDGIGSVGFMRVKSSNTNISGIRYGDNIGADSNPNNGPYEASEIMVQYGLFVDPKKEYASKKIDKKSVDAQNSLLKSVINDINNTSDKLYTITVPKDSRIIGSGQSTDNGYNRLFKTSIQSTSTNTNTKTGINYPIGVLSSYRSASIMMVSDDLSGPKKSLRMPSSNNFDAINTLKVINSDSFGPSGLSDLDNIGWLETKWSPYQHDQIAFYFYDIVNQNYIPFRATITGISEGGGAEWEALSFIGRADKVYSYNGFTRTLSFKFSVHISSIAELAPTWQRINYLSTLIKPSNYTTDTVAKNASVDGSKSKNNITNRFMIPPMVMLNVGDVYRDQPVIITQVGIAIPEDASWETLNEDNTSESDVDGNKIWNYLAKNIQSNKGMNFGQLPRTVDISLTMNLLEKEQPIAGGANFGHAPRNSIFKTNDWNINTPDNSKITDFNKNLVVDVNK